MTVPRTRKLAIDWITHGIAVGPDGREQSTLASNRYRVLLPGRALQAQGHVVRYVEAKHWNFDSGNKPDAVILGKLLHAGDAASFQALSGRVRAVAAQAAAAGVRVLADFNDDHFEDPVLGEHWRETARMSRMCVAGSESMAAVVRRRSGRPVAVVGDPVGSPAGEPKVFRGDRGWMRRLAGGANQRLKLAWYGNPVNWAALEDWARQLAPLAGEQPFIIWAVTRVSGAMESFVQDFNARHGPRALIELTPWDEQSQWSIVQDADAVLVPSRPSDPRMAVKTGNRVTDALHAGRYVFASPLPAYQPYAEYATLTEDPLAAVRSYVAEPDRHLRRLVAGQQACRLEAGEDVIAQAWLEAIHQAFDADPAPLPAGMPAALALQQATDPAGGGAAAGGVVAVADPTALRLNLGCGDKILPDYVNVDVVASRRGRKPDVLCDLRDLSVFADDSADEVMAIHVVEHFWRWEVEQILREWVRVLKPGGRMVLECPNLISACEEFLRNPDVASREDQAGQLTMWVFYGDPAWKDPYMIHRWGYTPASLGRLMSSLGLVDVRQEPAVYKLREPRDMRMVGFKPAR